MKYLFLLMLVAIFSLLPQDALAVKTKEKKELRGTWEDLKAKTLLQKETPLGEIKKEIKKEEAALVKDAPQRSKMIEIIKRRLKSFEEIIDIVPGLSKKEESGEVEYYFAAQGEIPLKLDSLDNKTLYKLYVTINRSATLLNTERIISQMRLIEQGGRGAGGGVPLAPVQPPSIPRQVQPPDHALRGAPAPQPPQPPQRPQMPPQPPPSPPRR